jgi:Ser/Thr protein kinase RdoA (MazF antagonist)
VRETTQSPELLVLAPGELGPRLGAGRQSEVHAWRPGRVIKLYRPGGTRAQVERERRNTAAARRLGFPAPAAHETVEVDGRPGLVLDRLAGPPVADLLFAAPWDAVRWGRRLAALHLRMHATPGGGLPAQQGLLAARIRASRELSIREQRAVLTLLFSLPGGTALCHGDLTPDNVLVDGDELRVVDWCRTHCGAGLADVANTWIKIDAGLATLDHPWRSRRRRYPAAAVALACGVFRRAYLRHYRRHRPFSRAELAAWTAVAAAAQLDGATPQAVWPRYRALIAARIGRDQAGAPALAVSPR